ncbi:MAG TPA: sigma factor-like helix-turn-helix DNA-binding protein [Candidatus Nanopelagicaceae bacterium]|nr:sigma factor-like helix-turn-helix DNA-binding protein [Candidatus Nanopelagicaceae bacterium]
MTADGLTDSRLQRQRLLDVYSPALTERQREALRLHLEEDWSVTELAEGLNISRAAAHDLIRRGLLRMEEMESQIGLCRRLEAAEQGRLALELKVARLEVQLRRMGSHS